MTQLDLRDALPGTICADCLHRWQHAEWCRQFRREIKQRRVKSCDGKEREDGDSAEQKRIYRE